MKDYCNIYSSAGCINYRSAKWAWEGGGGDSAQILFVSHFYTCFLSKISSISLSYVHYFFPSLSYSKTGFPTFQVFIHLYFGFYFSLFCTRILISFPIFLSPLSTFTLFLEFFVSTDILNFLAFLFLLSSFYSFPC
jgi:hypothetical protein